MMLLRLRQRPVPSSPAREASWQTWWGQPSQPPFAFQLMTHVRLKVDSFLANKLDDHAQLIKRRYDTQEGPLVSRNSHDPSLS